MPPPAVLYVSLADRIRILSPDGMMSNEMSRADWYALPEKIRDLEWKLEDAKRELNRVRPSDFIPEALAKIDARISQLILAGDWPRAEALGAVVGMLRSYTGAK
jgi:hypothetical protein